MIDAGKVPGAIIARCHEPSWPGAAKGLNQVPRTVLSRCLTTGIAPKKATLPRRGAGVIQHVWGRVLRKGRGVS